MSALENETLHDTTTFEYFGRTWTVPTKQHLSHMVKMRNEIRSGVGNIDVLLAETFLPAEEFEVLLLEVDPDADELDEFTSQIAKAMGLGDKGNS